MEALYKGEKFVPAEKSESVDNILARYEDIGIRQFGILWVLDQTSQATHDDFHETNRHRVGPGDRARPCRVR